MFNSYQFRNRGTILVVLDRVQDESGVVHVHSQMAMRVSDILYIEIRRTLKEGCPAVVTFGLSGKENSVGFPNDEEATKFYDILLKNLVCDAMMPLDDRDGFMDSIAQEA